MLPNNPEERKDKQSTSTVATDFGTFTHQSIAQKVREDIKQVLCNSWELQQLHRTAPKVSQATLDSLALPKRARIQQQVSCGLHDVCEFAKWKAAQLEKKRWAAQQAAKHEQQCKEAEQEALQGWYREKQQLHLQHQQQVEKEKAAARRTAALATLQAKADLQVLKEKQQKQHLHAAELRERPEQKNGHINSILTIMLPE